MSNKDLSAMEEILMEKMIMLKQVWMQVGMIKMK